ncbi:MAG: type IV pili methyl-accepting chemotaxis transducer N-terminal domain-containing protein, partial [Bacteroidota bacterium]
MPTNQPSNSIGDVTFNKLRSLYWLALTLIALSAIGSQILIQYYLKNQLDDGKVINIAGRQRMLSQKLTKEILLLADAEKGVDYRQNLEETLVQWTIAHEGLRFGNDSLELQGENSPLVQQLFTQINPYYENL